MQATNSCVVYFISLLMTSVCETYHGQHHRRQFLITSSGLLMATRLVQAWGASPAAYPFTLGIASGSPRPNSVILWTRLAPDPLNGGGLPMQDFQVRVRVCRDEQMRDSVIDELVYAPAGDGHSVHYRAAGLEPGRDYWYQFYFGDDASTVGRTRTAPAPDSELPVSIAVAACQHLETGLYAAYRDMAEQSPDLVVHLGDYIYEYAGEDNGRIRQHIGPEIRTLWDYRNRYAQYKQDAHLQAAHAASPWLVSLDDHEIDNNWAGYTPEDPGRQTELEFRVRRWAALKAFYEHMPLERPPSLNNLDSSLQIYDSFDFGRQVSLFLMDTRQNRSDQPCSQAFPSAPDCSDRFSENLTMTGAAQESALMDFLDRNQARWQILAQQTWFTRFRYPDNQYNMDQWDGYAQQERIRNRLADQQLNNPVVLSGDWHCGCAMDVNADFDNPESEPVAAELATTSISSRCPWASAVARALDENPQVRYWSDDRRGYVLCRLSNSQLTAEYRLVSDPRSADSPVLVDGVQRVVAGRRGFSS